MKIHSFFVYLTFIFTLHCTPTTASPLPTTIEKIKPSVVGVGTYNRLASPRSKLLGTGFVVGNGNLVATNAHVVSIELNNSQKEKIAIFVGRGSHGQKRDATLLAIDKKHDLALLRITGSPLKPLSLSNKTVREGELVAFTGFPIGAVLGLYPVTHQGIISSINPISIPVNTTKQLTMKQLKALKNPYNVYQLDATAYPGNSGSPVYEPNSGKVIAVINKTLVKTTKEAILSDPSAITYAIPVVHLKALMEAHQ
ncbi:S1 family peptidase [Vibrio alfacsensis]|uniref:S1 family peptidase n=1 Tax=Vibrio alfacsensis TaxID=1074311 RepID=UPI004067B4DF